MLRTSLLAGFAALLGVVANAGPAVAQITPQTPVDQAREIASDAMEGAIAGDDILLMDMDGGLAVLNVRKDELSTLMAHGVSDIQQDGDHVWIVRNPSPIVPPPDATDEEIEEAYAKPWPRVEIASYAGGKLGPPISVDLEGDERPLRLLMVGGKLALLSSTTLRIRSADGWTRTTLDDDAYGRTLAITGDGKTIYVGKNHGEWGGGLQAIDIASGHVRRIEKGDEETGCGDGPLYTACDPVTAVIADAERPACVYVGIGLQHFFSHGRVLRVCGDDIEVVFEKEIVLPPPPPGEEWVGGTGKEAVYGLGRSGKDLLILTSEGLHRLHDARIESIPMPDLDEKAGLGFTDKLPGIFVVASGANQRFSVSGMTPLLIPYD